MQDVIEIFNSKLTMQLFIRKKLLFKKVRNEVKSVTMVTYQNSYECMVVWLHTKTVMNVWLYGYIQK